MVAGLKFLSKKSFNPQNLTNQKTVWERQQQQQAETKRLNERRDQLKRERDEEELARARHGPKGGDLQQLKFMYDVPATTTTTTSTQQEEEEDTKVAPSSSSDVAIRQPGDDDAAAAFRQMLAAAALPNDKPHQTTTLQESTKSIQEKKGTVSLFSDNKGAAALSGTTIEQELKKKELSALEKAVGRREGGTNSSAGLTLEEQIARFPQLKNAPMAKGMTSTNVNVTFKPLGTQLRNTRCFACGVWGHSKGDRECQKSGWDPFSSTTSMIIRPNTTTTTTATTTTATTVQETSGAAVAKKDQKEQSQYDDKMDTRKRDNDNSGEAPDDSDDSRRRRRRKKHRKHKKSRKHESSKKRRRSYSSDDDDDSDERRHRKSSHKKRRKKHSRHDDE
jgi:CBF1 interacting corepressor